LVQEGMTNVAKHANSTRCEILLEFSEDLIKGQIVDYGKGFDIKEVLENPAEKFGLIGMKERIQMYSGKFSIESTIGKGTIFAFELPTLNKEVQAYDPGSNS
ncbi:MAG: histidine kinase, partial [Peptococcaceae bacterium]|nr:histidine kinase [Peptococcaceae bacterium]